jgi:hypothetical protein
MLSYYPQINELIYHGWYQVTSNCEGLTYEDIDDLSEKIMWDLNNRVLSKDYPILKQVLIAQTDEIIIGTHINLLLIFTTDTIYSDEKIKNFGQDLKEIFEIDRMDNRRYRLDDREIIIG